jgi:hypothetical protein
MDSTNKMLDAFHAMNVVIQKDLNATDGEAALLKYTADERAQLCARISHLFQGKSPKYTISTHLTANTSQSLQAPSNSNTHLATLYPTPTIPVIACLLRSSSTGRVSHQYYHLHSKHRRKEETSRRWLQQKMRTTRCCMRTRWSLDS